MLKNSQFHAKKPPGNGAAKARKDDGKGRWKHQISLTLIDDQVSRWRSAVFTLPDVSNDPFSVGCMRMVTKMESDIQYYLDSNFMRFHWSSGVILLRAR